jgi:very-short-patch-repair endonuclease
LTNARTVPLTFRRARLLRRERTDAERALWQMLRARRLTGLKFRRQFPSEISSPTSAVENAAS